MARVKASDAKKNNGANLGFEEKLWQAADKLRSHMDSAEYKHVVLGLIFLKYIFAASGLKAPEISILSDKFLEEVRELPHKNLALELLRKLLNDEIRARSRRNVVEGRSFGEMLEQAIRRYQNRTIEVAELVEELIEIAKEIRNAQRRGEDLGLTEEELAFYDALETNDSAVKVLGDETLRTIARELVQTVRRNVTIDWTVRESIRARLRTLVKRLLRKYGYPPDKQEKATLTILEQAELLGKDWVAVS